MFIVFFVLWLIFNSKITVEIIVFGIIISVTLSWFTSQVMGIKQVTLRTIIKNIFYGLLYVGILIIEIIKANIQIIKLVLSPVIELEPSLVYFSTDLKCNWSRVLLANSITLTPGTITVSLEGDKYCVHAMDRNMAKEIDESVFVEILRKMEKLNSKDQKLNSKIQMEV
ncbi:MAG: Na+/H+ antiporter subunit E [Clostridium sp.]